MKRMILCLFAMLLFLPALALADEMPAHVRTLLEEYHGGLSSVEYIGFTLENGRQAGFVITDGYSLEGVEYADEGWHFTLMTSVMFDMRQAHFERHTEDELAFDIVSEDGRSRLVYRFDGEEFRLAGWSFPDYPAVVVEGERLTYDMGTYFVEVVLPGGVTQHPWDVEDLPLTPERAEELADVTEQSVAELFPGYTLRGYAAYNHGTLADAAYSRIDSSGILHIRRVTFEAGDGPVVADCIPVPLSENLLSRLETEPFDSLISCWASGSTFLTQDAFLRESLSLPYDAVIRDNVVQENSVIALCEVDGVRYLYIWEKAESTGYSVRRTPPLPEDAYLDIFHAGDGVVQIEWAEQNMSASFVRREDGEWRLSWCTCYGPSADIHFSANAFGITFFEDDGRERMQIGTLVGSDLFIIRLSDLDGAAPDLDQTGWAVVNNPDPTDRLHLRVSADKSSRSQGKFYNGTPVRVLRQKGDWTEVQIGFGSTACTGWMMTEYLAFAESMDAVKTAFPDLFFREEYESSNRLDSGFWVVGVEDDKQYILLGQDGEVMYVPQHWLWEGNG